jgi:hypothetical protein
MQRTTAGHQREQEEQLERVPICTDCVGAGAANPFEVIPEEALNQGQQIVPLPALHGSNSLRTDGSDSDSATGFQQVQATLELQSDTFRSEYVVMAHIGRQPGDTSMKIRTLTVTTAQPLNCKSMPEVIWSRSDTPTSGF